MPRDVFLLQDLDILVPRTVENLQVLGLLTIMEPTYTEPPSQACPIHNLGQLTPWSLTVKLMFKRKMTLLSISLLCPHWNIQLPDPNTRPQPSITNMKVWISILLSDILLLGMINLVWKKMTPVTAAVMRMSICKFTCVAWRPTVAIIRFVDIVDISATNEDNNE